MSTPRRPDDYCTRMGQTKFIPLFEVPAKTELTLDYLNQRLADLTAFDTGLGLGLDEEDLMFFKFWLGVERIKTKEDKNDQ